MAHEFGHGFGCSHDDNIYEGEKRLMHSVDMITWEISVSDAIKASNTAH